MQRTAAGRRVGGEERQDEHASAEKQILQGRSRGVGFVKIICVSLPVLVVVLLLALKFVVFPYGGLHNAGGLCDAEARRNYVCAECKGKKALFIVSSWTSMGSKVAENGTLVPNPVRSDHTGVHLQEFAHPAYILHDLGFEVEFATPEGGAANLDEHPQVVAWLLGDWSSHRFSANDGNLKHKFANTARISELDFSQYDVISITGGWGPAFDLPVHKPLGDALVKAYKGGKTVIGGICHGTVGFTSAVDPETGRNIAEGKRCTGVTDALSRQMGIWDVPGMFHPEDTLRKTVKCDYSGHETGGVEFLAGSDLTKSLTRDGALVFAQNQNVGCAYSFALLDALKEVQGLRH